MPCNPSIGGTAKGHIVKEIDALGGEMGRAADKTFLQSRMLNRGKGPAVHSLRVQADRVAYHNLMKHTLERQLGLELKQAEVVDIRVDESGAVKEIETALGAVYAVKCVILATGTYLNSKIHVGETSPTSRSGRFYCSDRPDQNLRGGSGLTMRRFKTGTPARVHRRALIFPAGGTAGR